MTELLKSIASPIVWVLALMFLSLILTRRLPKTLRYKLGRWSLFLGMCILFLFSIEPISNLLVYSLEYQYKLPSDEILSNLDVVVILGGGMRTSGGFRKYPEARGVTYSRLFNGIRIFKQSGARTLVLCGGSPIQSNESEAEVMEALALELGVQQSKIITETKSRNTMENAAELAKLLSSTEKRRIGLVTSALHILRSEKAFRKQLPNDTIVPIPVNYIYSPDRHNLRSFVPSTDVFLMSDFAIHEWIGIIWYFTRY
ncbi:MAG: YdcF family protein [Sedimentisphaerales bacterium]